MRKIVKYELLVGIDYENGVSPQEDLVSQVRALIEAGWEPLGGAFADSGKRPDGSVYALYGQAMVKYE